MYPTITPGDTEAALAPAFGLAVVGLAVVVDTTGTVDVLNGSCPVVDGVSEPVPESMMTTLPGSHSGFVAPADAEACAADVGACVCAGAAAVVDGTAVVVVVMEVALAAPVPVPSPVVVVALEQ